MLRIRVFKAKLKILPKYSPLKRAVENTVFKLENVIVPGYICEIKVYSSPLLVVTEIWKKIFSLEMVKNDICLGRSRKQNAPFLKMHGPINIQCQCLE